MDFTGVLLRVTADEPGSLLLLEGDKPSLPPAMTGFLGSAALALVEGMARASGKSDLLRQTRRLRADRAAGALVIAEVEALHDEERTESLPLAEVESVRVRTRHDTPPSRGTRPAFSADNPRPVDVIVHLKNSAGASHDRLFRLDVQGVDTCEKIADLAFRLGAAMGLSQVRVIRSDPRRFEAEMSAHATEGLETMPAPESRADYARDQVSSAATRAAAQYRMPSPDPSNFPGGELRLVQWAPGDEVRADTPGQIMGIGCLSVGVVGHGG